MAFITSMVPTFSFVFYCAALDQINRPAYSSHTFSRPAENSMTHEIIVELDNLKLTVEVTHLVNDLPDPNCRDSADTARGERWVDFNVTYGVEYDQDNGQVIECGYLPWWLNKLQHENRDAVEAEIWKQYEARE
jgi:hypothetical protein